MSFDMENTTEATYIHREIAGWKEEKLKFKD